MNTQNNIIIMFFYLGKIDSIYEEIKNLFGNHNNGFTTNYLETKILVIFNLIKIFYNFHAYPHFFP